MDNKSSGTSDAMQENVIEAEAESSQPMETIPSCSNAGAVQTEAPLGQHVYPSIKCVHDAYEDQQEVDAFVVFRNKDDYSIPDDDESLTEDSSTEDDSDTDDSTTEDNESDLEDRNMKMTNKK